MLIWVPRNINEHLRHAVKFTFTRIQEGEKSTHYNKNSEVLLSEPINVAKLKIIKFVVHKKMLGKMKHFLLVVLFTLGLKTIMRLGNWSICMP